MESKFGFKVGDRVVYTEDDNAEFSEHCSGEHGTVCKLDGFGENRVGVEFDNYHVDFHSCGDSCKYHHGLYILVNELYHEIELPEFDAMTVDDISAFLN